MKQLDPDAERIATFGRRSFFAGAAAFAALDMAARLLDWPAWAMVPAGSALGWAARRVFDRLAADGAVAGAAPTTTRED